MASFTFFNKEKIQWKTGRAQNLAKKDTDMRLEDFDNDEDKIIQDRLKQNLDRDKNQ
jgi:hypothetical protein